MERDRRTTVDGVSMAPNPLSNISIARVLGRRKVLSMQQRLKEQQSRALVVAPTGNLFPAASAETHGNEINRIEDLHFNLFGPSRFRSSSTVGLHIEVFVFEFFTQLLFPLSIPFVMWKQGVLATINKGFIPGKPVFFSQSWTTLLSFAPIVLFAISSSEDAWALKPVVVASSFTLFRFLVIAGKYGSFKPKDYRNVVKGENYDCLKDLLLTTICATDAATELLIEDAEKESGICLAEMRFLLADGVTLLNARVYFTALVRAVLFCECTGHENVQKIARTGMGIVIALFPLRAFLADADTSRPASIVLVVLLVLQTIVYASVVFGFLGFSVGFYYRMHAIRVAHVRSLLFSGSSITSLFVRSEDAGNQSDEDDDALGDTAMIPACSPKNLIVWATVGNVIPHLNSTLARRMSFNFCANLALCVFLAGVLILQVWKKEVEDVYFMIVLSVIFGLMSIGMLYSAFIALLANRADDHVIKRLEEENFAFHWREKMSEEILSYKNSRHNADSSSETISNSSNGETYVPFLDFENHKEQAQSYTETMEIVRELIQRRNEVDPIRVMYVGANIELVSFLGSVVVSGVMLIIGAIYQSVPE